MAPATLRTFLISPTMPLQAVFRYASGRSALAVAEQCAFPRGICKNLSNHPHISSLFSQQQEKKREKKEPISPSTPRQPLFSPHPSVPAEFLPLSTSFPPATLVGPVGTGPLHNAVPDGFCSSTTRRRTRRGFAAEPSPPANPICRMTWDSAGLPFPKGKRKKRKRKKGNKRQDTDMSSISSFLPTFRPLSIIRTHGGMQTLLVPALPVPVSILLAADDFHELPKGNPSHTLRRVIY